MFEQTSRSSASRRNAGAEEDAMDAKAKEALKPVLAEFREGIAHHRAEGATEERIKQILSATVRLAVQQVDDPELCLWLCDEFTKAANVAPIVTNHPVSPTLH